ncbi:hypothetical protein ACFWHR_13445 [Leucobacter sp. NPDC058333]|uniref:hypothetical protein n=1 Tax=Leucobacter sp. NPDC058333 TaxID=3346450 RepID=UPI003664D5CC
MPRPFSPLPDSLGTVFTSAEARAAGVPSRRLQAPDVDLVLLGVYRRRSALPEAEDEPPHPSVAWRERQLKKAHAAAPSLDTNCCFSHTTAAVILGLPVPHRRDDDLDIACTSAASAPRTRGVRARQLAGTNVRYGIVRGLPVPSAPDLWAMLGDELAHPDLVALGDAVIHRPRIPGTQRLERAPFATADELRATIANAPRAGTSALHNAVDLLVTASASAPASHLRLLLATWGLPRPSLDYDVRRTGGASRFTGALLGASEFAYPRYRVAIEYEGPLHRSLARHWSRDEDRHHAYEEAGWRVIRIAATLQYTHPHELRARILSALRQRGWSP